MRFDIHTDSGKTTSRRSAPNYSSYSVRLRLATLVILLGLVLIAMNKAGKPETWKKLGFRSQPPAVESRVDSESRQDESVTELTPGKSSSSSVSQFDEFWQDFFRNSSRDERKSLFAMIRAMRNQEALGNELTADAGTLVPRIRNKYEKFEKLGTRDADKKSVEHAIKSLADSAAGKIGDEDSIRQAIALQQILDPLAFDLIEDRTSMNRSEEVPAWTRSWERLAGAADVDFEAVSYIQLAGQPEAWRGKAIRIRGDVRGMELLASDNPERESEPYIVLWIKPIDSNQTPYCVYVKKLPDSFPLDSTVPLNEFQKLNQPVVVNGIFFKLRSYLAVNEKIETCPLILANTVKLQPVALPDTSVGWKPPTWLLVLFFIGMPIIAAWLAITVYRSTMTPRPALGGGAQKELEHSLAALANESSVRTDQQKVQELYEHDRPND